VTYAQDPAPGSYRRWAIFGMGSLNFVLSMFYRVSTTVISPALAQDVGLTSSQLGDLSAAFYYAFAISQIPLGLALDRWGARKSMSCLAFAAVGGALLFALGENLTQLVLARVLLGIGMSGNLMAVLALLAAWFPVNRFGFMSGIVVSVGVLGNLLAATPLALLSQSLGWRGSFLAFGFANALVVLVFVLVTRDTPDGKRLTHSNRKPLLAGLGHLAGMYSYWAISVANFVRYGYFAALQGLWVGPFLINGIGLEEIAAANAVLFMGLGYMISLPVTGFMSDRLVRSRKKVVLPALVCFALLNFSILFWTRDIPYLIVLVSFFGLGFFAAPGQIMYAHIKELIPASIIAQAMTAVNLFTVLGAAVMTQALGMLVAEGSSGMSGPDGFRIIWHVGLITLALVSFLYAWVPDSRELRQ
jgi:sugar phosphate permease